MNSREPRSYPYEDQPVYSSQIAAHNVDYTAVDEYTYDNSGHYYAVTNPHLNDNSDRTSYSIEHEPDAQVSLPPIPNQSTSYYRSTTPTVLPSHRYPTPSRELRYNTSQGYAHNPVVGQSTYPSAQTPPYPPHYLPLSDQNPSFSPHQPLQSTRFIPTPSEIANSYSTYPQTIVEGSAHDSSYGASSLDYPPPHLIPPSGRPARIMTARPRGGSSNGSPSSASSSSPSGERFLCEKCGKTFSRSHDRKRHYETQHLASPVVHRCGYCRKEFSRADSLKRHLDNGCDEMRS